MKVEEIRHYEDLEHYLREFSNFSGDPVPHDFVGAFQLFLAILENLATHGLDAEVEGLEEECPAFTEKQLSFLRKLKQLEMKD